MNNYAIDDDIDFFTEINHCIDDSQENDHICLITNQHLKAHHVILPCRHAFNYNPLYNDILNHKQKFNMMESGEHRLSEHEIRCPYCLAKHTMVLPYYETMGLPKISGVNYIKPPVVSGCQKILTRGPNKGNVCGCTIHNISPDLCNRHYKIK